MCESMHVGVSLFYWLKKEKQQRCENVGEVKVQEEEEGLMCFILQHKLSTSLIDCDR